MANQNQNSTITDQVRLHGEMLARLTVLVEEDHKDLAELKAATGIIAKAVAGQEARDAFKSRVWNIATPIITTALGVLVDHLVFLR